MVDNIVGIIGPGGCGGHFLDWTLHYLIGHDNIKYVWVDRQQTLFRQVLDQKIKHNPLKNDGTAHLHLTTHPTEELIQICLDQFCLMSDENITIRTMFITPKKTSFHSRRTYTSIVNDVTEKYTEIKFIHFIYPDKSLEDFAQRIYTKVPKTIHTANISINSMRTFVEIGSYDPNKIINKPNVYPLNIDTMFFNLNSEIRKIFDWLSLSINEERYSHWIDVYKQWQVAQNFCTTIES